jgi:hypothetical protein
MILKILEQNIIHDWQHPKKDLETAQQTFPGHCQQGKSSKAAETPAKLSPLK